MSSNRNPIFSLIIPTRERADTLKHTLQSALNQSSTDYEIIVSDNNGQDDTKQVVKAFSDSRIVYLNTGKSLSMCDNWDYALKHARGDYVIIIGDDDGVMPNGIDRLQAFIADNPSLIYSWRTHEYFWPIGDHPPTLTMEVRKRKPFIMNLKKLVRFAVRWGAWRYGSLPLLYHAAVSKQILDKIRQQTGRVFHSTNPDVFMAFTLPVFSDTAINVGESITVNGRSAKSNGGSFVAKEGAAVFQRFVDEYGDYQMHATLDPTAPFAINMIADTALTAMDLFPEYYKDMEFNYSAMWAYINRISFFKSTTDILEMRKAIRKFHPISVPQFIFYTIIHKILAIRVQMRDVSLETEFDKPPLNINEFVQYMADKP